MAAALPASLESSLGAGLENSPSPRLLPLPLLLLLPVASFPGSQPLMPALLFVAAGGGGRNPVCRLLCPRGSRPAKEWNRHWIQFFLLKPALAGPVEQGIQSTGRCAPPPLPPFSYTL